MSNAFSGKVQVQPLPGSWRLKTVKVVDADPFSPFSGVDFPHNLCIVLYRTSIVLYRTCIHKCIHRAYVCSIHFDTHSIRNLGFGGGSAVYRALDTELISVIFVSFMYRICIGEVSKRLYRFLYRFLYRAFLDQYRKRIENYVSFLYRSRIISVSYMYLT